MGSQCTIYDLSDAYLPDAWLAGTSLRKTNLGDAKLHGNLKWRTRSKRIFVERISERRTSRGRLRRRSLLEPTLVGIAGPAAGRATQ